MLPKKPCISKDTRPAIYVPLARNTNLPKQSSNLYQKGGGEILGRFWAKIVLKTTQPNVTLKRRDSQCSTDIDRQNK